MGKKFAKNTEGQYDVLVEGQSVSFSALHLKNIGCLGSGPKVGFTLAWKCTVVDEVGCTSESSGALVKNTANPTPRRF